MIVKIKRKGQCHNNSEKIFCHFYASTSFSEVLNHWFRSATTKHHENKNHNYPMKNGKKSVVC